MGVEGIERNLVLTLECCSSEVHKIWPMDNQWPMSFIEVAGRITGLKKILNLISNNT
jgi:hypothetical protein